MIDLRKCKKGDILISSHGMELEYVSPTPYKYFKYLDHVLKFTDNGSLSTYTHDGFVFKNVRIPATDHDIVKIIHK